MKVNFKTELSFIMKKDITEGNLEERGGGTYLFYTEKGFKQILKQGERDQMMAAAGLPLDESDKGKSSAKAADASPGAESTKATNPDGAGDNPKLVREKELSEMTNKELKAKADELYENVGKGLNKADLVKLILDAEFPEAE